MMGISSFGHPNVGNASCVETLLTSTCTFARAAGRPLSQGTLSKHTLRDTCIPPGFQGKYQHARPERGVAKGVYVGAQRSLVLRATIEVIDVRAGHNSARPPLQVT
jgi:hypothetical protein